MAQEFTDAKPFYLNKYYRGKSLVSLAVIGVPTSGVPIRASSMYGKTKDVIAATPGLSGYFIGESWTGSQWTDISGANKHATQVQGAVSQQVKGLKDRTILTGSATAGLRFPAASLPSTYTIFHIAKYNATGGRIFDCVEANWLSGFWGGKSGLAHHNAWITSETTNVHGTNWVLSTDQHALYRSNKVNRTNRTPGARATYQLSINYGQYYPSESSSWSCACVAIFNRELGLTEYTNIENYLASLYDL